MYIIYIYNKCIFEVILVQNKLHHQYIYNISPSRRIQQYYYLSISYIYISIIYFYINRQCNNIYNMCDFHIFIDIFDDISTFHHFNHFFVNFFSCGVWGGCGGVAGLHRKVFILHCNWFEHSSNTIKRSIQDKDQKAKRSILN